MPPLSTKLPAPVPPPRLLARPRPRAPVPRRRLVTRARLVDRLRADPTTMPRLVLVSAPAGFGKTTLLTQWLTAVQAHDRSEVPTLPGMRAGWLSLDATDNDLRAFLTHLVAALRVAHDQVGAEALALMDTERGLPLEAIVAALGTPPDVAGAPPTGALDTSHATAPPGAPRAVPSLPAPPPPRAPRPMTTRGAPPLPLPR